MRCPGAEGEGQGSPCPGPPSGALCSASALATSPSRPPVPVSGPAATPPIFLTQPLHPSSWGDERVLGCTVLTEVQWGSAHPTPWSPPLLPRKGFPSDSGAGGAASDSPAAPRPSLLRGKGKLVLPPGPGRARCLHAPCLPGPRSLQALRRPPGWGRVNTVVVWTIPVPDEETRTAGGRSPTRAGQRQHPDPGGWKALRREGRAPAPPFTCWRGRVGNQDSVRFHAATPATRVRPGTRTCAVHTTTWALVFPAPNRAQPACPWTGAQMGRTSTPWGNVPLG